VGVRALSGVVALAVGIAVLGGAGASAAGPRASAAKVKTLELKLGDRLKVKGTTLACVVQNSGGVVNLACLDGSLSKPIPHSYAVGIANKGADLAQVSASGGSAKVVTVVQEPTISGGDFVVPAGGPKAYAVAPTTALLIGGTHVFCAVQTTSGTVNVTCGLSSLADKLQFPSGSYTVSESAKFSVLGKVQPHNGFKTVAAKTQP